MTKTEVFKMQRPLFTDGDPSVLVYNKGRTQTKEFPLTEEVLKWMGKDYKVFVRGRIVDGRFDWIKAKLPDPGW